MRGLSEIDAANIRAMAQRALPRARSKHWEVTLTNTHASCSYRAEGFTKEEAYYSALKRADGGEFLTYGGVNADQWEQGFNHCYRYIRVASKISWSNARRDVHVTLARV